MWECLTKIMLHDPKKRKIGSKTSDCVFIGYVSNSAAYRFIVLKSDVLECNAIIETKKCRIFLTHFSTFEKISYTPTTMDDMESYHGELRRSKRQRKEVSFGNDF